MQEPTDIISCVLYLHMIKQNPACEDDETSLGDSLVPKNATTEELEALGATLNFIDIWIKILEENYYMRSEMYNKAMK